MEKGKGKKSNLSSRLDNILKNFIEKRKYQVAIEDLNKLQDEYGNVPAVIYNLGVCYANVGDKKNAIENLGFISDSEDLSLIQIIQTNMLLGYCYTELSDLEKAEKHFKEVIEINPQSSMAFSALGYVYYLAKKYDLAIFHFKKAIQIDPNNAGAHNNLGYTYAEIGINLNEAMKECRRAVTLNPKSAAYRDSLGWVYFTLNNFKEATKELETALQFPCANKEMIYEHLNLAIKKRDLKK